MSYFTINEARKAARDEVRKSYKTNSRNILESYVSTASSYDQFDVFLSHSINDSDLVLGVKVLLENKGLKVYVDWHDDPQVSRDNVTPKTADLLRKRMKQSKSLIYIATKNSTESKWMPWELGFFDGYSDGSVAVLPLMDYSHSSFIGQEYLGLYPKVEKGVYSDTGGADTFVKNSTSWMTLKGFGKKSESWMSYSK